MLKAYVTHVPHFLDKKGLLPEDIPVPARELAVAIGKIISYVTFDAEEDDEVPSCLATIRKKRCQGKVEVGIGLLGDNNIEWRCTSCDSCGIISGWQGTLWDLSERETLH
jgi:hypothetical protein